MEKKQTGHIWNLRKNEIKFCFTIYESNEKIIDTYQLKSRGGGRKETYREQDEVWF